jgi:hypothetical protein
MAIRILYDADTWDAGTITSSSEASTDLADDNAVHDFVGKPWRTTGDTSETWTIDLGSAVSTTIFGIFNHNFTSGATVKYQANATDSWGSPTVDETLTIATDSDSVVLPRLVYFPSHAALRWRRIDIADASNPDGYIQVGRFIGGAYWEPTRTITDGFPMTSNDPSTGSRAPGTGFFARQRAKYRSAQVAFELAGRTDHDKWQTVFEKVGQTKPLILALDPTNYPTKDSMYCKVASPLTQVFREADLFDTPTLTFVEETR